MNLEPFLSSPRLASMAVSIPNRDLMNLERFRLESKTIRGEVSIPNRDLMNLERAYWDYSCPRG